MKLAEIAAKYEKELGYSRLNAVARTCQDVILAKLDASSLRDNISIKGGILIVQWLPEFLETAPSPCIRQ